MWYSSKDREPKMCSLQPKSDRTRKGLAVEIERRLAAHPELASDVELRLVDGRYVVMLGDALRARLSAVLTENAPPGPGGA